MYISEVSTNQTVRCCLQPHTLLHTFSIRVWSGLSPPYRTSVWAERRGPVKRPRLMKWDQYAADLINPVKLGERGRDTAGDQDTVQDRHHKLQVGGLQLHRVQTALSIQCCFRSTAGQWDLWAPTCYIHTHKRLVNVFLQLDSFRLFSGVPFPFSTMSVVASSTLFGSVLPKDICSPNGPENSCL